MFGATALRRKREKERRERAAKCGANRIYPYIKPFGKNTFYPRSNNSEFWEIESLPRTTKCKVWCVLKWKLADVFRKCHKSRNQSIKLSFYPFYYFFSWKK